MAAVVIDASIVLGLLDPADAHHQKAMRVVDGRRLAGQTLVLPVSVLSEVLVGAHRVSRAAEVEDQVRVLVPSLRPLDRDVAVAAAALRARHRALRLPDALVLATAEVDNADVLTADAAWSRYSDRVEVIG